MSKAAEKDSTASGNKESYVTILLICLDKSVEPSIM